MSKYKGLKPLKSLNDEKGEKKCESKIKASFIKN